MKYVLTLLLLMVVMILPAQRSALYKGIALYESKDYDNSFKKLTPVVKRLQRLPPEDRAAAVYYYNLVKINIFKRMYRMGLSDKLYNFLLEGYKGFDEVQKYDPSGRWSGDVRLYKTMYYPFVMESAENLLKEAQAAKGLTENKRLQNYLDAEAFVRLGLGIRETSGAYVLLGQAELGKDDTQKAYSHFSRALSFYQTDKGGKNVDFSIGRAIYYKALIENASNLTSTAIKTLQWGQAFLENEHLRFNSTRENRAPIILVKAESQYLSIRGDLSRLEESYKTKSPGDYALAQQSFEQEIQRNPNDYLNLIAYANTLGDTDEERAVQLYEKAAQVSPDNLLALKKLSLVLLRKAQALTSSGRDSATDEVQKVETSILERIYPHLQKVIASDPDSGEVLEALLYIADRLDLRDDYRAYRAMRDKIDK